MRIQCQLFNKKHAAVFQIKYKKAMLVSQYKSGLLHTITTVYLPVTSTRTLFSAYISKTSIL